MSSDEESPPKNRWEIKVRLRVVDSPLSNEEITTLVGITPTRAHLPGDPLPSSSMKRKRKSWVLEAPAAPADALQEHVDSLLSIVEPAAPQFAELAHDACIVLSCAIYDYSRDAVLGFDKQSVEKLAAIGAHIDIDYYDMSHADDRITRDVQLP